MGLTIQETKRLKSDKILVALQFWEGDRVPAEKLAGLIGDLEPKHSTQADFLLVNRFDCAPLSNVSQLSRKFNVFTYQSRARVVGWPAGCNALWISTMEWVSSMLQDRKIPNYKAIFTCEADGAPLYADWISRLSTAWDKIPSKVVVAGPMVGSRTGPIHTHINGNMMLTGNFSFLQSAVKHAHSLPGGVGWDYALSNWFENQGWANMPEIVSIYNTPEFFEDQYTELRDRGVVWVHGDKSSSLVKLGRKHLLGQKS